METAFQRWGLCPGLQLGRLRAVPAWPLLVCRGTPVPSSPSVPGPLGFLLLFRLQESPSLCPAWTHSSPDPGNSCGAPPTGT